MQAIEHVFCPFCGQQFELVLDLSVDQQQFTTDCEVCCRPFEVTMETRDGSLSNIEIHG